MAAASQSTKPKPLPLHRQFPHEYDIWAGMKQRCNNKKCREYRYYGERGIRVCRRWSGKDGFKHFIQDMGPQRFKRASVHRIDNNGNYTPGNVEWADHKTQARHMRSNRVVTYRVVLCWLACHAAEVERSELLRNRAGESLKAADQRVSRAHARLMSPTKALATVRKLISPMTPKLKLLPAPAIHSACDSRPSLPAFAG